MADTYVGGSYTFASDDISSVHYARIKLVHGADGASAGDVALTNPFPTTPIGIATNGLTIHRSIDLDESEEEVKATAGVVYGMWVCNLATTTRYIKFYNAAAADVTVGTTAPVITIPIPGNSADDVSGAFNVGGMGIGFGTAICVAATTGLADNDTGAPSAGDVVVNIFYK